MYNENWDRWICASIYKHFEDGATIPMFVEADERETDKEPVYFECRVDGPTAREISKDYWHLTLDIGTLICSIIDKRKLYIQRTEAGKIAKLMLPCIPIYKYGDQTGDDKTFAFNIIRSDGGRRDGIENKHIGQVEPSVLLNRSIVEAKYFVKLDGI